MKKIEFRKFDQKDFPDYRCWFDAQEISGALGPAPDQQWLDHVLSEESGRQFSAFLDGLLVGVVGVTFSNASDDRNVITDIAIKPELQRTGLGSRIVVELVSILETEPNRSSIWVAFVDQINVSAVRFFENLGWQKFDATSEDWKAYEFRKPASTC